MYRDLHRRSLIPLATLLSLWACSGGPVEPPRESRSGLPGPKSLDFISEITMEPQGGEHYTGMQRYWKTTVVEAPFLRRMRGWLAELRATDPTPDSPDSAVWEITTREGPVRAVSRPYGQGTVTEFWICRGDSLPTLAAQACLDTDTQGSNQSWVFAAGLNGGATLWLHHREDQEGSMTWAFSSLPTQDGARQEGVLWNEPTGAPGSGAHYIASPTNTAWQCWDPDGRDTHCP